METGMTDWLLAALFTALGLAALGLAALLLGGVVIWVWLRRRAPA
jgi:hypothetical protein